MKSTLLFLSLLCTCALSAQSMTTTSTSTIRESETDDSYRFFVKTNSIDKQLLLATFSEVANTEVNGNFSGDWTENGENGVSISMHTRRNFISVKYKGEDAAAMADAKEKATVIRERLGLQAPPTPPGIN